MSVPQSDDRPPAAAESGAVNPISVRLAGAADARAIATIATLGWQRAYRGLLPDEFLDRLSIDRRELGWRSLLENNPPERAPTWLAERGRRAVGFVSTGPPRDDDAPPGAIELYAIYVLPEAWRGGVGRALLETATSHWRARGATPLLLWVLEGNDRARRFYEAFGWRPDGGRQEFALGEASAIEVRYRLE